MNKQTEYEMFVKVNPVKLIFTIGKDSPMLSLQELNAQGAKLVLVFETKDDRQQINRRIAIFEWKDSK